MAFVFDPNFTMRGRLRARGAFIDDERDVVFMSASGQPGVRYFALRLGGGREEVGGQMYQIILKQRCENEKIIYEIGRSLGAYKNMSPIESDPEFFKKNIDKIRGLVKEAILADAEYSYITGSLNGAFDPSNYEFEFLF